MITNNYPEIRNILHAVFSVQVGLSEEDERRSFHQALRSPVWRDRFEKELKCAFSSRHTSWADLLCNDSYEVGAARSEAESRQYAAQILWYPTFPGVAVPDAL